MALATHLDDSASRPRAKAKSAPCELEPMAELKGPKLCGFQSTEEFDIFYIDMLKYHKISIYKPICLNSGFKASSSFPCNFFFFFGGVHGMYCFLARFVKSREVCECECTVGVSLRVPMNHQ